MGKKDYNILFTRDSDETNICWMSILCQELW